MDVAGLEFIRSVLTNRRRRIEDELPSLDAAISRLDELLNTEAERVSEQDRFREMSAFRRQAG